MQCTSGVCILLNAEITFFPGLTTSLSDTQQENPSGISNSWWGGKSDYVPVEVEATLRRGQEDVGTVGGEGWTEETVDSSSKC